MMTSRRRLLGATAAGAAFIGLSRYAAAAGTPADIEADRYGGEIEGYGRLRTDPFGIFDLPEGFSYTVISRAGEPMSDGLVTPYKTDGMGCLALDRDRVILVRNHELAFDDCDYGALGVGQTLAGRVDASRIYDRDQDGRALAGGTTTMVYDLRKRKLESAHLSLLGTTKNCAGGTTPWGSWLTCEEAVQPAGIQSNRRGTLKSHGWVFEVPGAQRALAEPRPITGLGRFRHEAAVVDPATGIVYLTEDEPDGYGLFYRFLPHDRRDLHKGGRLQALGFADNRDYGDSRNWDQADWTAAGQWREAMWVDLDGVDNPDEALRARGHARGAAWFARGEGVFFGQGELYFACTSGGARRLGQIMRYRPSANEGQPHEQDAPGRLQLFLESADPLLMNMGDNLAVSPWGHLFVCEDKAGEGGINYLRAVTPTGKVYTVGRQAMTGASNVGANAELAGVCFSPDGTTLFVNIYWPGLTLAITGPWGRLRG
jgi:secreted PhoX family phosphatase